MHPVWHYLATAFFGGVLLFAMAETGFQLWHNRARIIAAIMGGDHVG